MKAWLNTIFERIYVISKSHTPYDEKTTIHSFEQSGIEYLPIEYHAESESSTALREALIRAKANGYKSVCVCLDDLLMIDKFEERLACACKCFPKQWKIINLGLMQHDWKNIDLNLMKLRNVYPLTTSSFGSFAVGFAASVYDILLAQLAEVKKPMNEYPLAGIYARHREQCSGLFPNLFIRPREGQHATAYARFKWDEALYPIPSNRHSINEKKKIHHLAPAFHHARHIEQLNNHYNNLTCAENLADYLRGKRVALVCYPLDLESIEDGENIDDYDVVVRAHTSWDHPEKMDKYIGSRTDIVYSSLHPAYSSSCEMDVDRMQECGIRFFVSATKYDYLCKGHDDPTFVDGSMMYAYARFHLKNQDKIEFVRIPDTFYCYYDKLIGGHATPGLLAFLHLLTFDIKQIYLRGLGVSFTGSTNDGKEVVVDGDAIITLDN